MDFVRTSAFLVSFRVFHAYTGFESGIRTAEVVASGLVSLF